MSEVKHLFEFFYVDYFGIHQVAISSLYRPGPVFADYYQARIDETRTMYITLDTNAQWIEVGRAPSELSEMIGEQIENNCG
ncbi:MAG: hypothetical protein JST87_18575 [Bacteroidetes bacterium]|nr:hypothetical protein [Bacteroidota bacterium]